MKRRRFLAAVGTGTAFAAGCVGRGPDAGAEPTDRESETATDDEPTDRVRDQETALAETTSVESNTTTNGGTPTESPTQSRTATETNGKGEGSTIQRRVSVANVEEVPEISGRHRRGVARIHGDGGTHRSTAHHDHERGVEAQNLDRGGKMWSVQSAQWTERDAGFDPAPAVPHPVDRPSREPLGAGIARRTKRASSPRMAV